MDLFENRGASPMLIKRQMEAFDDPDWIYELKLDGFRCLAYIDRNMIDLRNKRNMQLLFRFPELAYVYKNAKERCILDGEIVVLSDGVPDFYRLQKRTLLADERELEGVMAKKKDSLYYMGKRTADWIKFKRMADEDFVVAGYIQQGQRTYSLILSKYRMNTLIYKGHVTSGVTGDAIGALKISGKNPFSLLPPGNEHAVWAEPDHVCVIEYMPNLLNSLRQPVFKGYRDDVSPAEIQEF